MTDEPLNEPQSDDYEAAFAEYAGGEKPEGTTEPAESEATEPESDDQGEEVSEQQDDVSARLKALEAENAKLKHSEQSQRGRLGAYQRQINELHSKLQQTEQSTASQPDEDQRRQEAAESAGAEDWESLKQDFPEVAKALESRLSAEAQRQEADRQRQAQLEQRLEQLQSAVEPIQEQAQTEYLKTQVNALEARHPDWQEVVAAPAFSEWLDQQPESLRKLTESNDAAEAAALMDLYKSQQGAGGNSDRRQERLASAQSVPRRGSAPKGGPPDDFEAAFKHYANKR